jgi:hypothetical protein
MRTPSAQPQAKMTLHLWKTRKLAVELADGRLSERTGMQYMLVGSLLYAYNNYWALWFGSYRDAWFFLELFAFVIVGLFGVFECYKANGEDKGADFILRFCALAVPVGFKVAVLGLFAGQALYFGAEYVIDARTFRDPGLVYRYLYFALTVSLAFVYYWRIAHHITSIRAIRESRVEASAIAP